MMYNIILIYNSKFKIKQNKKKLSLLPSTLTYEAGLKKSLIEIKFNLDYDSKKKTSTSSILSLYISLLLLSLLFTSINSPFTYYNMSQYNINQILLQIRQQVK